MKKTFFNFGLFLALGLTIVVFNSCKKDDDIVGGTKGGTNDGNASKITATNVINGTTQIKTVKALVYWESGDEDYGTDAIAQASYQNNGFTLELPATLGAKYLETLDADDLEGISVSDRNFKSCFLDDLSGYNEHDDKIGDFYLEEENEDSQHYTSWMYVDRDVTIKGEYNEINEEYNAEHINKYDLTLKKGWNLVYYSFTYHYENSRDVYSYTLSSNKPLGVNYTWNFYVLDYSYSSASLALKSARNSKLVSSKLKGNKKKQ
ncbi:MAG: hypothetical protein RBS19_06760 [Bacteroidales bacterium]|nr:hypothetical protein [Bacteroidales bacterium]MDY0216637.1 hypothetical protein [Bacteroidales bacterium]